jgi:sec-independent protein translocase protein TatC
MSFGDHLEEFRSCLLRALTAFFIGMLVSFLFGDRVVHFLTHPVEKQLMAFYNRRVEKLAKNLQAGEKALVELNQPREVSLEVNRKELAQVLGLQLPNPAGADDGEGAWVELPVRIKPLSWTMVVHDAQRLVGRPPQLSTMNVMEGFMVWVKVCAMTGLVLSSPWVFWQIWMFVAAGLFPHEKRFVHVYLPFSLGLFLAGVAVCEYFVLPKAIDALLWFNEWLGLEPDLRLNEWLSFALLLPLVFGISFQTPLVMLFLAKIGIFDAESFRQKRRIAWFAMAVIAAVITPVDALSMLMLLVPMCGLYELGIWMVHYTAVPAEEESDPTTEEMVEV